MFTAVFNVVGLKRTQRYRKAVWVFGSSRLAGQEDRRIYLVIPLRDFLLSESDFLVSYVLVKAANVCERLQKWVLSLCFPECAN